MKWKTALFFTFLCYALIIPLINPFNLPAHVSAQPPLTVDQFYVEKERADMVFGANIGAHIVWTHDNSPLQWARVYFKDKPGFYLTNSQGWCFFSASWNEVGNKSISVDRIYYGSAQYNFQQIVPDPWVIFDKVLIELNTTSPRIGVNTEASINYTARYAYDDSPFQGEIVYNYEDVASPDLGTRVYQVEEIIDDLFDIRTFESNSVEIISDRVNITLTADRERYDAGREAEINWTAHYEYDQTPFHGELTFNTSLTQNEPGVYVFTVASIEDEIHDVESFTSNSVGLLYDAILVTFEVEDTRVNVGEKLNVTWHGVYGFDSQPFNGSITFNVESLTSDTVLRTGFLSERAHDPFYNLTSAFSDVVEVVWDRVNVSIEAEDERINIGDEAVLQVTATYESDGSPFLGEVELSTYVTSLDTVGDIVYEVVQVTDPQYDINSFSYDPLKVVWDRVNLRIRFPQERTGIGTEATPTIDGYYEYNRKDFEGSVQFNGSLIKGDLGKHGFTISSIEDEEYGITSFVSNEGQSYWDRYVIDRKVKSLLPGKMRIEFKVTYEYDNSPVRGSMFYANGKLCNEIKPGTYVREVSNLGPFITISSEVLDPGFEADYSLGIGFCWGNIVVYAVLVALVVKFGLLRFI